MVKKLLFSLTTLVLMSLLNVAFAQKEMSICAMAEKALIATDSRPGSCNVFRTMESIRFGNYSFKGVEIAIERHYVDGAVILRNTYNENWKYTIKKMNGNVIAQGDLADGINKIQGFEFGSYLILCENSDGISTLDQINIAPLKNITSVAASSSE